MEKQETYFDNFGRAVIFQIMFLEKPLCFKIPMIIF